MPVATKGAMLARKESGRSARPAYHLPWDEAAVIASAEDDRLSPCTRPKSRALAPKWSRAWSIKLDPQPQSREALAAPRTGVVRRRWKGARDAGKSCEGRKARSRGEVTAPRP
jgi:hypothetical protein